MVTDKSITGSEIIVHVLAEHGVDTIFGYSGGAILPTYDAVFQYNEINKTNAMPLDLLVLQQIQVILKSTSHVS